VVLATPARDAGGRIELEPQPGVPIRSPGTHSVGGSSTSGEDPG